MIPSTTSRVRRPRRAGLRLPVPLSAARPREPATSVLRRLREARVDIRAAAVRVVRDLAPLFPTDVSLTGEALDPLVKLVAIGLVLDIGGTPGYSLTSAHPTVRALSYVAVERALAAELRVGIPLALPFPEGP